MADFFAKRKHTAVPKINLIEKETTAPAPPKKKYLKHTTTNGFNSKNINMTMLRTTCHVNQKANGEITKIL